jgi:tetratricopeptide (TPR) repeat protein
MKFIFIKIAIILLIFHGGFILAGQNTKDSLLLVLPVSSGEEQLHVIDKLLGFTIYNNLDTSYYYAKKLLQRAKELNNKKYESIAYSWFTVYSFFKGEYYKGEDYIKKAIEIQERIHDTLDMGNSYINLVMIYAETGRYKKAVESSFKALELFKKIDNIHGIIVATGNIGIMFNKLKDYENAVKYLRRTSSMMMQNHEFSNLGELYNNMGLSFYHLNINDSAVMCFFKAINEYNKNNELKGTARAYLNLANTYAYNIKNFDSAFRYYDLSLKVSIGVIDGLKTKIFFNKGKTFALKNDYDKAIKYLNMALEKAKQNKELVEQEDIYYELFEIYKKGGLYLKAIGYFEKYNSIKDSLDLKNAQITIANLESKFENEKNLMRIKELEARQESDRKIKNLLITAFVLVVFILLLVIWIFYLRKKSDNLKKELLTVKNIQLEKDIKYKSRQLTSQALMMMQKNKLLNNILYIISGIKGIPDEQKNQIKELQIKLKKSIHSEEDWELFKHYFEDVNPDFFSKVLNINHKITSSELKLCALIKLNFTIKETASLLNITPDSVKTLRYVLRKKLGIKKGVNIYDFISNL